VDGLILRVEQEPPTAQGPDLPHEA
jgi:hypothetical protein